MKSEGQRFHAKWWRWGWVNGRRGGFHPCLEAGGCKGLGGCDTLPPPCPYQQEAARG